MRATEVYVDNRPVLVIVGGAPASGKSTLAQTLAERLRLPLFSRDDFKEALMDTLGSPDPDASHELGAAAYAVLALIQQRLIDAGVGTVVESNFVRGESEDDFSPVVPRSRAVLVHCQTSLEESKRRFVQRAENGERHPGHHDRDPDKVGELEEHLLEGRYDPLMLPVPTLVVDTSSEQCVPAEDDVIVWINERTQC